MKTGLLAGLFSVLFSATVFAAPVLKINSSGRDVMLLQQKLQNVGYTIKDIDGIFGEETKRVVTQFQKDNNLRATGVVNNATWRALKDTKSIHHGSIKDKEALLERLKSTAPNYGPTVQQQADPRAQQGQQHHLDSQVVHRRALQLRRRDAKGL